MRLNLPDDFVSVAVRIETAVNECKKAELFRHKVLFKFRLLTWRRVRNAAPLLFQTLAVA
jgi:hypothetical protein